VVRAGLTDTLVEEQLQKTMTVKAVKKCFM
jgi:hypothetical protein